MSGTGPRARLSRLQTEKPLMSGSSAARRMRSGRAALQRSTAGSPCGTLTTWKPAGAKARRTSSARAGSDSMCTSCRAMGPPARRQRTTIPRIARAAQKQRKCYRSAMPPSFALTAEVACDQAELAAAALFEGGALGVEERDDSVAPMPGLRRPERGRCLLVAWFAGRDQAERAAAEAGLDAEVAEVPDQDWSETWKRGLGALSLGRTFVRPSWVRAEAPPGAAEVVLDPGMAFGTGAHPTTALCLLALDELLASRPGASALDP